MKSNRVFYFCLLTFLFCGIFPATELKAEDFHNYFSFCNEFENQFYERQLNRTIDSSVKMLPDGGIREVVPGRYRERFEKWKEEFLSTEFGREQWDEYAENKNFVLIIKITDEDGEGGGTSDYQWDENGNLVGATIVLGSRINKGFPSPVYYPVLNSLSVANSIDKEGENTLAAVKLAHEFGHVNQTSKTDGNFFRQQNKLIIEYNKIFESNKFNTNEPRLTSLAQKLGGTPLDIWASREYWGERNAMFYLLDRLNSEKLYCPVVNKIGINVKTFAVNYEDRFSPVFKSSETCQNE